MLENRVEQALRKATIKRGGYCWKWVAPGMAGVPDRIVMLPGGKVGFVECKAPGGKPRPQQVARMDQLKELGLKVFVLDCLEDVEVVLDAIT